MPLSRVVTAALAFIAVLAAALAPAAAQQPQSPAQPEPTQPFAPAWGMLAGWDVFANKGCGKCHAIRGFGGGIGPDLGRIQTGKSFFEIGAAMWNHLPRMGERMRAVRIERPQLTPKEASDVIAFIFTAQYFDELGDAKAGEKLFASKGCVQCHAVGGKGGSVGPALDAMKRANSPVLVAAAMWNHGPQMAEVMKAKGILRPAFQGREMVDLIAYVVEAAKDAGGETAQVVPGTPERGEKLFAERQCVACHSVGGKGADGRRRGDPLREGRSGLLRARDRLRRPRCPSGVVAPLGQRRRTRRARFRRAECRPAQSLRTNPSIFLAARTGAHRAAGWARTLRNVSPALPASRVVEGHVRPEGVLMSVETETTPSQALSRRELVERLFAVGAGALARALGGGGAVTVLTSAPPARAAVPEGGIPTRRKYRYGMVIDTRRCVGCRACVVACKAENKTPPGVSYTVVLEQAVANRFDDKPIFMTKPCFHCENPPCVDVCPVSATFKRERDGIVVIDYDRCIGCRYCITGCPYGARYFDFGENYAPVAAGTPYAQVPSPEYGQFRRRTDGSPVGNVRKCTFCLHLQDSEGRYDRKAGRWPACAKTCTGHAIFFGDFNDPEGEVSKLVRERQPVRLKEELGTEPNVHYLL